MSAVAAAQTERAAQPQLSTLMKEIGPRATGWHAMLVGLSRLPVGDKRTNAAQAVMARIEQACTLPHGTLALPNRDVLCLVNDKTAGTIGPLADLAAQTLEELGIKPGASYIRRFNLERELSSFIALLSGVDTAKAVTPPRPAERHSLLPAELENRLLPKDIAKIEKMFYKANVSNFVRNQTISRLVTDTELEDVCEEIFISIEYLMKFFAHQEITSDVWLFQYFTRTLDARLLYLMGVGAEGEHKKITYNLNLNVATLFSEDFLIYDKAVPPRVRQDQTIEIQAFDLIENANDMPFVRNFLRGRGYRLCVDGVDKDLFMLLDWDALDVDVVKLRWSPDFTSGDADFEHKVGTLASSGRCEIVLCRCSEESAVDWGARVGVKLFQGWYLDGLSKPRNTGQPKPRYKIRLRDMIY